MADARKYDYILPCKGGTFRAYLTPVLGVKVNVVLCTKCKLPHSGHKPVARRGAAQPVQR